MLDLKPGDKVLVPARVEVVGSDHHEDGGKLIHVSIRGAGSTRSMWLDPESVVRPPMACAECGFSEPYCLCGKA